LGKASTPVAQIKIRIDKTLNQPKIADYFHKSFGMDYKETTKRLDSNINKQKTFTQKGDWRGQTLLGGWNPETKDVYYNKFKGLPRKTTQIHENLHAASYRGLNSNGNHQIGFLEMHPTTYERRYNGINEGINERFAQKITHPSGNKKHIGYSELTQASHFVAEFAGERAVAKAYFGIDGYNINNIINNYEKTLGANPSGLFIAMDDENSKEIFGLLEKHISDKIKTASPQELSNLSKSLSNIERNLNMYGERQDNLSSLNIIKNCQQQIEQKRTLQPQAISSPTQPTPVQQQPAISAPAIGNNTPTGPSTFSQMGIPPISSGQNLRQSFHTNAQYGPMGLNVVNNMQHAMTRQMTAPTIGIPPIPMPPIGGRR